MAGLEIKLTQIQGDDLSALAEMTGAIDGNTVPNFQATLEEIKTKGIRRLVLDMSKIKYVNSTGLGSLVKYADTFKSSGGGMALIKVPAKVKIVIEMLGLNAFFDICPDLDAALAALAQAQGGGGSAPPAAETKKSSLPPRVAPSGSHATGSFKRPGPASGAQSAPAAPAAAPQRASGNGGGGGFPQVVKCEGCAVQVEVTSAGNWKCPRCYTFVSARPDGVVRFTRSDKPVPLNLSLAATQDCGEGLVHLVTSVCQTAFNNGQKLESLRLAVHEVATVMAQSVYPNNPQGVYHVSIERQQGWVQIRFADAGATIESGRAAQYFPHAHRQMSEFECRPHPTGGNMIRFVQRA
ncbi:MAG: anti-sigma factor antagonist [Planctomycetes bacterium]|nr:anti-sigma factor antagonist [Planctomycetota bacterium]